MERDFMGLNSKDTVKKEAKEIDGFEAFKNHLDGGIQQSAHWLQLHCDTKQAVPVMTNPFFRPVFAGAPVKLAGVPVTSHSVLPSTGPFFAHPTEPWFRSSKVASAPAQLTIFYGGMVNVYDGISPEKAQAIMFMAGNGSFIGAGNSSPTTPVTPIRPQPCSAVSSPISVSSHPFGPPDQNERVMSSLGQAMQSAVPQARKASLARFLEKRKERVMASFPYSLSKNNIDYASSSNSQAIAVASK
ncbi:TIFY 6B-like protein isoform X1 [Tanacetum coccineum]|uniref:Protein TIFY n=1 Tax=Tanacetum coccineum TaxID=301880 RepID=A0ABQ5BHE4_9ASTR